MKSIQYYVYVLASLSKVLYVGVTNDLERRVWEHKQGLRKGFTKKYRVKKLVYFEATNDITFASKEKKR